MERLARFRIFPMALSFSMASLLTSCSTFGVATRAIPPGAAELGYTKCAIDERPRVSDIAPGKSGDYAWFSGQWYTAQPPSLERYQMVDGVLALKLGGDLVSAPRDFSAPGLLPALPGDKGFYVEFDVRLSDDDPDHWPAVWLMPREHNGRQEDRYAGDPKGYERWMELDVDEGGFGPGLTGTVHSWSDTYPHYRHVQNPNNVRKEPLDRSLPHTFGASYDPKTQTATWWLDGVRQMSATAPHVPEVAARQRFYLILSAQSHRAKKDYLMFVSGVRAFVPPDSPLPSVP